MKIKQHFFLLLLFFIFNFSKAQNILVFDKNTNEPILEYQLEITDSSILKNNIITNQYELYNFKLFTVKNSDYKEQTKSIFTKVDTLIFYLVPSILKLNEIVVSANKFYEYKKDLPRQIYSINQKEISFQNRQNTADLLENSGTVFVQKSQQGGGSPVLRGFESNRVLLVIDGIRMNNAIYRGGHLQNILRIDQNTLNRTEVLFGGGSVIYGSDALGGVLYFETLKPKLNSIENNAFYRFGNVNNESTFHYQLNLGFKKWAHILSFTNSNFNDLRQGTNKESIEGDSIYNRNYYAGRINNRDTMLKNSDPSLQIGTAYSQYNLMYKLLFEANKKTNHIITFQLSNTSNVPRFDRLNQWKGTKNYKSAEWYYGPELHFLTSYNLNKFVKSKLADNYKLTLAFQYIEESRNDRSWQSVYLNKRSEYVHVTSLNLDAIKSIKKNKNSIHEIRYGLDGQFNYVASNAHDEHIKTGAITMIPTRYPDGGSNMVYMAAFVSHSWEIGKKFIVSDGLRFNYVSLNSKFNNKTFFPFLKNSLEQNNTALNGNLGLVFNPNKNIKIYSNLSSAFRAPNLDDVSKVFDSKAGEAIIIPNPNLQPEYTYNYEIGVSTIYKNIKLEAVGYYTQIQNAIVVKPSQLNGLDSAFYNGLNTKVTSNQNAQQAYIYGYNVQLSIDLWKTVMLYSSLNYTYGRIISNNNETPLDHIPPMFGKSAISFNKNKLNTEISLVYNGWKYLNDFNINGEDNAMYATHKGSPAWFIINLKAQYTLSKKFKTQLQAGIDNITDIQYRIFSSGVSAAGRNIWAGVRLKF